MDNNTVNYAGKSSKYILDLYNSDGGKTVLANVKSIAKNHAIKFDDLSFDPATGKYTFAINNYGIDSATSKAIDDYLMSDGVITFNDTTDGKPLKPIVPSNDGKASNPEKEADNADHNAKTEEVTKDVKTTQVTRNTVAMAAKYANAIWHSAWDPRLKRLDAFLYKADDTMDKCIRVPFATNTIASTFGDKIFHLEKQTALEMLKQSTNGMPMYDLGQYGITFGDNGNPISESSAENANGNQTSSDAARIQNMGATQKIAVSNTTQLRNKAYYYGGQSLMNPYSLTTLVGGIGALTETTAANYMYDIRDRRRFDDQSVTQQSGVNDPITVSNPTITNIITWSNADKWGRTPYSYQDFVFNKWFGILPTNSLITFRRYPAPTYDNLNFSEMYGPIEEAEVDPIDGLNSGSKKVFATNYNNPQGTFSPLATVVSYFGGDTGNQLSSLLNFDTGYKWKSVTSDVFNVEGNEGESPEQVIDKMFEGGGYGSADKDWVDSWLKTGSLVSSKIMSFGKFAMGVNSDWGKVSQASYEKTMNAQTDPYGQGGPYQNRIMGPLNRINEVKMRDAGIEFSQSLSIKVSYKAKSIGGINPKAALLDCMANALEMASPHAIFWGGGHRFNIDPQIYAFHSGGWRTDYMTRIYQGKFLGKDGAIAAVAGGFKQYAGTDSNGNINWDGLKDKMAGAAGGLLGAISAGLAAISSAINIGGISDVLDWASNAIGGAGTKVGGEEAVNAGISKLKNFGNNISGLWRDKCLQNTTLPTMRGMGALLIGEPVGEWHLTIGNPLRPIAVIGNLICTKASFQWDDEIGPDDFPTGFSVTYSIEHGMARDSDAIQSMFNRGAGKIYNLPDYVKFSSDYETQVDTYSEPYQQGVTGKLSYMDPTYVKNLMTTKGGVEIPAQTKNSWNIPEGTTLKNSGNAATTFITHFTPPNTNANSTLSDIRNKTFINSNTISIYRSLAATRKQVGE